MSFMFNPHPYDDPKAVNRIDLDNKTIDSVVRGTKVTADYIGSQIIEKLELKQKVVVALDGYIGAELDQVVHLVSQYLGLLSIKPEVINVFDVFKSSDQLEEELSQYLEVDLEKDPVLLFGKLFKGEYEDITDNKRLESLIQALKNQPRDSASRKQVVIVYGQGSTMKSLRALYDYIVYFDVPPKEVILRARRGRYKNLGDELAKPVKAMLRRCYYVDFELASHLRWDLIRHNEIDSYVIDTDPDDLKLIPRKSFNDIMAKLSHYPFRCKPVYNEGVWGGYFFKYLRNLPDSMRNCAWVFDLIPLEVSVVVEAGQHLLEFPFFTFVQKEGEQLMGAACVEKFNGYFPIRFNYDDSYHSSGNMSIQVHSGHDYNVNNYCEHGRQDESYYVVATGHDAKTYIGFKTDADPKEFIKQVKKSEKNHIPVDYKKFVNHVKSEPGMQLMLPAGTIHSSGRNQVVLEIGSLTVGSYTYKMYDYLRADLDGKPRPIHSYHGEKVLRQDRNTEWVNKHLIQDPQMLRSGEGWAEQIVGEHDLIYFSLRRMEFEKSIEDDTDGLFHVLVLVDGENVVIESVENPSFHFKQDFLEMVIVPARMGKYRVRNLGDHPVCIHKTMLKENFMSDALPDH